MQEIIIREFLENWYTYDELSDYLCIDKKDIEKTLSKSNLETLGLKQSIIQKIEFHKQHIKQSINNYFINCNDDRDKRILDIANYIIFSKASIRKSAEHFDMNKSYLYDLMIEKLPEISIQHYKKVFIILKSNKSYGIEKKEIIEQVLKCFFLYKHGLTEREIAQKLNISEKIVQRNLSNRLKLLDKNKYDEIAPLLKENKIRGLNK